MNTIEGSTSEKIIKILAVVTLIAALLIGVYRLQVYYAYESIKVVVHESKAVEYGTANYDVNSLIKKVEGKIVSIKQDVDTTKVGEQEVVLQVKKGKIVKDVSFNVDVVDTAAPEIAIKNEKITLTEGDNYDLTHNIESVSDIVDGEIGYSGEATEDSNFYYDFTYGEDIDDVGEHEVVVNAKDKNGNVTQTKFTIEVKPRPVVVQPRYNTTSTQATYANVAPNAAGGDLVSIAYSLVGSPYISGANGPYGFDCSGFVQYVYSRVGIGVSRSSYTQAYDGVGVNYASAQPGDILNWGHGGRVTHSALYVGNGLMIHATNPSQGVVVSNVAAWDAGSYDSLMGVRRIR